MSSRAVRSLVILAVAVVFSAGLALAVRPGDGLWSEPIPVVSDAAMTEEAPAMTPAVAMTEAPACAESAQTLDTDDSDELVVGAAAARPCKPCKDRPWCDCRYNGLPRVSCNPCCYGNLGIPQVCFD